jgi:regulatory protein
MRRFGTRKPLDPERAADPKSANVMAITLLARRDFSAAELRRKLKDRGYTEAAIAPVLSELEGARIVDDRRFGDNMVAARARRGQGPRRIQQELRKSGLSAETIQTTMDQAKEEGPDFIALARATRSRKFGSEIPKDRKERARQARFLQYRGFSTDHIRAVLEGVPDDDDPDADFSGESDPS